MLSRIHAVLQHRAVLKLLVARDLKVKYADSYLGYVWTVLDPLLMSLVLWFVFTLLGRGHLGAQPYIVFLLNGMLPWNWFNGVVGGATRVIGGDSKLIRSTNLPREIWVLKLVGSKAVEMVYSLPVLIFFVLLLGPRPGWYLLTLPLAVLIQSVLLVGLALMVAPVSVLVGDMDRLVRIVLRVAFYMTPIIYSAKNVYDRDVIPEWAKTLYSLNPMVGIIDLYRAALFPAEFHGWWLVGVAAAVSVVVFLLGWRVFARLESPVLKEL